MIVRFIAVAAMTAAMMGVSQAQATPIIDGSLDAAFYGAAKSTVAYSAAAPENNFSASTSSSNVTDYSIYLASDANNVYGFLKSSGPSASQGSFSNLY